MDNPNPIRYSDLIAPDNSITDLIAQLEELIAKYEGIRSKIQTSASQAAQSVQNLSGATEEQRKSIQLATEQSEKLLAQYRDTRATLDALNTKYQDSNAALKEFTKIQKLVDEVNRSAEGSYNRLSAQYRLNKIRLNEMSQAEREGTAAGRQLEAETKAIYERMNDLQKATGKAQLQVGQYERSLGGLIGVNTNLINTLTDSTKRTEAFSGAMRAMASPIGTIIGIIGSVTAAVKLFKESIHETQSTGDSFDNEMAGWTATWDAFKKAVSTVDFSGFIVSAREAAAAGRSLQAVMDETFERTNSARILRASMSEENAVLRETMQDTRKSYEERLAAADKYLANMKPIYEQEEETAKRNRDAQLEYLFSITNRVKYATKEERDAAKEKLALYIQNYNINERIIKDARAYLQAQEDVKAAEKGLRTAESAEMTKYYDEQRKAAQKRINSASKDVVAMSKLVKQYNLTSDAEVKAYVDAEEKYQTARAASYNDQRRIVTMRNNLEAQQTKEQEAQEKERAKNAEDAAKAQKAAKEAEIKAEKDAAKEREKVAEREAKERQKAEEEAKKERQRKEKEEIDTQRAVLNSDLQAIQLEMASTEEGTAEMLDLRLAMIRKEREIELFENKQKAEQMRQDEAKINAKYDKKVLNEVAKLNTRTAAINTNSRKAKRFELEAEKKRLEDILSLDDKEHNLTKDARKAVEDAIDGVKDEIDSLPYNNLYEVLGLNVNDKQQKALNTAIDSVIGSVNSIIDSWNAAADAALKAADAQVEAAQKTLDAEIEARNAGYANEVSTAQKELELAKKNREKAAKEKEKAQKAQLAVDSVTQASSLVTASANLWASLSPVPIVGPALAIAAIATMWGSFAFAKVKAAQVAKQQTETYGEGTVELLQGGSHASGHDIDLGTKKDGTRRRAEGGEYFAVINKRNSRRYGRLIPDVINAFNNGTFADKYQRANATMGGYAVGLVGGNGTDVSALEKDVAAIREQGLRSQYVDGDGNTVVKYKNLTRKIYKS